MSEGEDSLKGESDITGIIFNFYPLILLELYQRKKELLLLIFGTLIICPLPIVIPRQRLR